jgi:hypothetical protein
MFLKTELIPFGRCDCFKPRVIIPGPGGTLKALIGDYTGLA